MIPTDNPLLLLRKENETRMSEAAAIAAQSGATPEPQSASNLIHELRVTGHLMTLESGLFCIIQTQAHPGDPRSGLPGVRVSLPPGPGSRPEAVSIAAFRPDGWLNGAGDAALVRVIGGPAHILVTIYQMPDSQGSAPSLQVVKLTEGAAGLQGAGVATGRRMDVLAHIAGKGDIGAPLGEWLGTPGSDTWIEGFAIAPTLDIVADDIEYQAVLGRDWKSPWVEGGQFCGSRGMALPVLGLCVRLRGTAAENFDLRYSAAFVDGTEVGPVGAGAPCESEGLSPMVALKIEITAKSK